MTICYAAGGDHHAPTLATLVANPGLSLAQQPVEDMPSYANVG